MGLEDRYRQEEGIVFLTGVQAIVRFLLDQRGADRLAGIDTAGFVSGYPGSPLAGLDLELERQKGLLSAAGVIHRPGVNEELAATAVEGSQLVQGYSGARHQGVFGVWYGKAPGLDRATDAIRHANLMGTHTRGGVLALVGDDPTAKSSTVPSASEGGMCDLGLPVLYPADPQEMLDFAFHAIAMSRSCGLWAGMKVATNVADGMGSVEVGCGRVRPVLPELTLDGRPYQHRPNGHVLGAVLMEMERSLIEARLEGARRYGAENHLNRVVASSPADWMGIVAAGKTYLDVRQALLGMGLDDEVLARHGIRLLKLGMPFPLDEALVRRFGAGLREIVVVEEKRPFVELFVKDALYGVTDRPTVVGRRDERGGPLLSGAGELDPDAIAIALGPRLLAGHQIPSVQARLDGLTRLEHLAQESTAAGAVLRRTAYFCSGCPHNRSAQVPDGALVGGGIGCHGMVLLMSPRQVGEVIGLTQMGGEGAQWIGMAPFTE
ncbi:MAG: indolepyruvate ferredoxin oxidoreductase family protein, partial [Acidimicrobiia bacterium]